ncbi:MAG TPA: hypothetical protein VMB85_25555 [Bryobacteraceae bacterium]|nr:hypothetical protein [Bryobacteraceae bacterium]
MKASFLHVAVLYAVGALTSSLLGQKPSRLDLSRLSPSQLVKFVTYQNRSDAYDGTLTCDADSPAKKKDQDAIERLVSLGERSVPALEQEFGAISKKGENGQYTPNLQRLFYVYARIRGARAFPRLRDMELSQQFSFATVSLDGAIAVALGLTSYLSIAHPSQRLLVACQGQQPRDALNQMIVAWERGDPLWFETSLGETAARAVAVKDDDEWQAFRGTFWRDAPNAAIGYKFQVPARLSEPSMRIPSQARVPNEEEKLDLDTAFYGRNGRNCGHMMIKLIRGATAKPPGYLRYVVDNPNIADVLQLISACARQ